MPLKKRKRLTRRKGGNIHGRSTRRREILHLRSIDVFFKKVCQAVNKLESETMYKVKEAIAKLVMNTEIEERQNECNEIAPTRNSRPTPKKMSADRATRKKPLDPVDQFFREIARTVKTLKPETSERLKTTIAELVMDAEIEQMEKKVKVEVEETEEDIKPQTGEMLEYVKLETEEVKLEVEESPNEEPSALDSL